MTNKERSGRDKLMEAIRISERNYCDKFPLANGAIQYSEDYLQEVDSILKKSRNPIRRCFNTVGKRVAAAVIVVAVLGGSMMSISAVREPVVEFITNVYEKFVAIFFDKDDVAKAPDTIETVYILGIIPNEYKIDQFLIGDTLTYMTWKNETGERLVLSQDILKGSSMLDKEESNYDIIGWNGRRIAFAEKYGVKYFFWNSDEYAFSLTVSSNISQEEAFALIDSLKKYNQ